MNVSDLDGDRPAPCIAFERECLSGAMQDPLVADRLVEILEPSDFLAPRHRRLFTAIAALSLRREGTDVAAVTSIAFSMGLPVIFVLNVAEEVTTSTRATIAARMVLVASQLRQIARIARETAEMADRADLTLDAPSEVLDALRASTDAVQSRVPGKGPRQIATFDPDLLERIESDAQTPRGLATGFDKIDLGVGGLRDGEVIVLGARPSVGKSLLAANIAENVSSAESGARPVLFFSLEMSGQALYRRCLFGRSGVSQDAALGGYASSEEKALVRAANSEIKRMPIYVHPQSAINAQRMHALARRFVAKHGPCLIVVDYLQLMTGPGLGRTELVTNLSAAMKTMAVDLNVPVLVLAQLNRQAAEVRGAHGTEIKIPTLSDLRDSGAIEQDADVVLLLARDTMRHEPHPVDVVIAKNRPGRTGKAQILFDTVGPRFRDIETVESFNGKN